MAGNLGINPSFKEFSSFKELEIPNIQAEGILIMSKQGMDGDSDVAANGCPASVLLQGNHLAPPDSPPSLCLGWPACSSSFVAT